MGCEGCEGVAGFDAGVEVQGEVEGLDVGGGGGAGLGEVHGCGVRGTTTFRYARQVVVVMVVAVVMMVAVGVRNRQVEMFLR